MGEASKGSRKGGHHGPVPSQRDRALLLQQQWQGAECALAAQGRGGGGAGADGQPAGAADQPAGGGSHRRQPPLPPAHLLPAGQPGGGRPVRGRGLPLPHVPHRPTHGRPLAGRLVPAPGPAGCQPDGLGGHAAGHRRGAPPQRYGRAAAQPTAAGPRGTAHRGRVGHGAGPGAAARTLLALPVRAGPLLAHGAAAQPHLPDGLGAVQPAGLPAHAGRLHPHLPLRAAPRAAHVRARLLPPALPRDHAQPGQDGGHHPGSVRGLLDASAGGAAPGRAGLPVLQRPGRGEVFPAAGRIQLAGQCRRVLLPRRRDAPHLPPPALLPVSPPLPALDRLPRPHWATQRQHPHHVARERLCPHGLHPLASKPDQPDRRAPKPGPGGRPAPRHLRLGVPSRTPSSGA